MESCLSGKYVFKRNACLVAQLDGGRYAAPRHGKKIRRGADEYVLSGKIRRLLFLLGAFPRMGTPFDGNARGRRLEQCGAEILLV